MNMKITFIAVVLTFVVVLTGGCDGQHRPGYPSDGPQRVEIPEPVNALLPRQILIHPFTGTSVFSEAGDIKGIDVRIEARDAYGDNTKAFGQFRFELYHFKPNSLDPKGALIAVWNENIDNLKKNRLHWKKVHKLYQFKLALSQAISSQTKFVLAAVFQSRFTDRLFDERVFISEP